MCLCLFVARAVGQGGIVSHAIQISNDADDGYYNGYDGSGWHSDSQYGNGSADLVGSWGGITAAWVVGYRFPSTGINSGDTIRSAYLELVSSDSSASSVTCGSAPCPSTNSTFRVYGVAQDNGASFSNTAGNTPVSVPYTASYVDYTTTGPGDVHGSCQGENNGQDTCTHIIDVTNIVKEVTSRPGWTNTSAIRFVMLSTNSSAPNVYAGFEDFSANHAKAATLEVNPPQPTIVSSGGWGTSASVTYPTSYEVGPFVYPGASTIFMFLGDYFNFYGQAISQPTVTDNCGNIWNILAGPTDWTGYAYDMRATVYYVENPASCAAGDTITVDVPVEEPIFLHFLAVAGSNTAQVPATTAITSPPSATYLSSAPTDSLTVGGVGQLLSWIFGDSDSPHTFTPQTGYTTDTNSIPTYLTAVSENVSSPGSYQNTYSISPSADGWETLLIDVPAASTGTSTPMVTVTPSATTITPSQPLTVTVLVSGSPVPTGSVVLTGGGYASGTTPLTDGGATIDIPGGSLNLGADSLTATYTPDTGSSSIYSSATGTTSVTVANAAPASMASPTPGSTLTSGTTTFTWTAAVGNVTGYYVWVGTSPGTANLGGYTAPPGLSQTVNLPTNGAAIYVRLWTLINGTYLYNDYAYTEANLAAATMSSPTPGSTLTSGTTTFTWAAGTGNVTAYYVWIGTSPGTANIGGYTPPPGTSFTVTLPTNGATIYVRLWTYINGGTTQLYNDYTYTEANLAAATMESPTPGSTLTSPTTTFTWAAGTGNVTAYYVWIGTSPGTANIGGYTPPPGTSFTVNLPTNGATIYVRLWTLINGSYLYNDYIYTEATIAAATMASPTPGSTLTLGTTTFTWAAGTGNVTAYYVWIGTSPGTANIGGYTPPPGTSLRVNLPTSGATIYVRLWTYINGSTWLYNDYTYTEAN